MIIGERGGLRDCAVTAYDQIPEHRITELEHTRDFIDRRLVTFNVQENVMCFVHLADVVSQMAASPIFKSVDVTPAPLNQAAVFVDHCADLLTLVRMDQKNDLVMSHSTLLSV